MLRVLGKEMHLEASSKTTQEETLEVNLLRNVQGLPEEVQNLKRRTAWGSSIIHGSTGGGSARGPLSRERMAGRVRPHHGLAFCLQWQGWSHTWYNIHEP